MTLGRGFVGAFLAVYVVVIGIPLAPGVTITPTSADRSSTTPSIISSKLATPSKPPITNQANTDQTPSTATNIKVELGIDPGTLRIDFPAGTKQSFAIAAVGPLGLSLISGDVGTGHYVFALPKISVYIERAETEDNAIDRAWIRFPRIYSDEDVASYLGKNRLALSRWSFDHETGDRFAVVDLPRLEAQLTDAERGLYSITLIPTDEATLAAWARESGVRIIEYNDKTGEAIVQPLDGEARHSAGAKHDARAGAHRTADVGSHSRCGPERARRVLVHRRNVLGAGCTAAECHAEPSTLAGTDGCTFIEQWRPCAEAAQPDRAGV